jgi:hypothetical protein
MLGACVQVFRPPPITVQVIFYVLKHALYSRLSPLWVMADAVGRNSPHASTAVVSRVRCTWVRPKIYFEGVLLVEGKR